MSDLETLHKIQLMLDKMDIVPEQSKEIDEELARTQDYLICDIYNDLEDLQSEIDPTGDLRFLLEKQER